MMFLKRFFELSHLFFPLPFSFRSVAKKNCLRSILSLLLIFSSRNYFSQCTLGLRDTLVFKKLSINTDKNEYSPFLFNSKLYFTADLPADESVSSMNKDHTSTTNIFFAAQMDSVTFDKPVAHPRLNSKLNDGPISFAGENAVFASNLRETIKEHKFLPSRLYATTNGPESGEIYKLEIHVSDTMSISQPCIVGDTLLYFVGKRPRSGTGGDIYSSVKTGTAWGEPLKLKYPVNTANDDCFPFSYNGRLYFSSNREGGKGGLDFYVLDGDSVKLISGLNSEGDDYGICFQDQHSGYVSSNRDGSDDIYYFYLAQKPNFTGTKPMVYNSYCYRFKEETTFESKDTVNMIYEWDFGDGQKAKGLVLDHCYPGEGKYNVSLKAIQKDNKMRFETKLEYELDVLNERQPYIASYDSVPINTKVSFDAGHTIIDNFVPKEYYWDFGEGKFYEGAVVTHEFTKTGVVQIKLLVKGISNGKSVTRGVYKTVHILADASLTKDAKIRVPTYYKKWKINLKL
jgi:hypothetical protein